MRKVVVILWLVLVQTIMAQTKIVVLSDLHLMAPSLLVNDGPAWRHLLDTDRKLLDFSQPLLDEAIERIKTIHPQLVLITGDLTKDGETASHEYVVQKLNELKSAGIMTLVIPGNHDIDMGSAAVAYDGESTTPVASPSLDEFATMYADYGYGPTSVLDGMSMTYSFEPIDGLVVIGINSGKNASIATETLHWVCQQASAATSAGKKVIVMMHHALLHHITNADQFVSTTVINNHDEIRNRLIDAGVKVILTGHFHTSDIAKDYNDNFTESIYDIATGSLASYPCDYRELQLSADMTKLEVTTGHITSTQGNYQFTPDSARVRLHAAIVRPVMEKGMAKLIEKYGEQVAPVMEPTLTVLANYVADAYIIHAEGDEYKVDTEKLLKHFSNELITSMMPSSYDAFYSMLKDLSCYGIAGRENQTDDLSLTIDMGAPVPTAVHVATRATISECCYDLHGHKLQSPPAKGIYIRAHNKRYAY